ncbi:hypothetical protein HELRODRAFT_183588 [Helobdella robusta]|uniref:Uncharacterized protein n=1 Tax=Helobdella robusta TaxID=6412 RepID=T1FJW0_HELRO|nr:hypothetical protein HELRODRAFT_183588 [Helobdella robusta]ESO10487.1 hypothetical protein HELRODRAFT_183588 [Helobdella robusta]
MTDTIRFPSGLLKAAEVNPSTLEHFCNFACCGQSGCRGCVQPTLWYYDCLTFSTDQELPRDSQSSIDIVDEDEEIEQEGSSGRVFSVSVFTSTTRVRILPFLQVYPGGRPPVNPAVYPFEVDKCVNDVSCCMLADEMAQWFECSLSQTSQWLSLYSAYRCDACACT